MNKMLKGMLFCCLFLTSFLCLTRSVFGQTIHYVKPGGLGAGTSWTDALGDIRVAIAQASSGDQIFIAKGQYNPDQTLVIDKSIQLHGGFAGTENNLSERNLSLVLTSNATVIQGKLTQTAIYVNPVSVTDQLIFEGLTIQGAGRSALFSERGDLRISWCKFENNHSVNGGAIYLASGNADISNCIFNGNEANESALRSINYPLPSNWTLLNYRVGTDDSRGWANGVNEYQDKEKAMFFDVSGTSERYLQKIYIGFGLASTNNPAKIVPIKIYDGTSGAPGHLLGTQNLTMQQIRDAVIQNQFNVIWFDQPIAIPSSKKFFVSVDLTNLQWSATQKDVLSIMSNTDGQTVPSPIWEKQSDNTWYRYTTDGTFALRASLLIHPFLSDVPFMPLYSELGGAIFQATAGTFNVRNSVFNENKAGYGGALFNYADQAASSSSTEITNNTFYNNTAISEGGAIYNYKYSEVTRPKIYNTIIWGNHAVEGQDIYDDGTHAALAKNNITQGYQSGSNFNRMIDPLFTNAANQDFSLSLSSPAIDAGDKNLFAGLQANTKDLANNERVYQFAAGGLIDIGAYESSIAKPIVNVSAGETSFTEADNALSVPVKVDSLLTLINLGNNNLILATLSIVQGFQATEDVLAFENDGSTMGDITAQYDAGTGILSLTSPNELASLAEWAAALRSVTYTNLSNVPETTTRVIQFIVSNGYLDNNAVSKSVSVVAVNDSPVNHVPEDIQVIDKDTILEFNVANNNRISVSDLDTRVNTMRVRLTATNGVLTLSGISDLVFITGSGADDVVMFFEGTMDAINAALDGLRFKPNAGYLGSATIRMETFDFGDLGDTVPKTDDDVINITVQGLNPIVTQIRALVSDGTYKIGEEITLAVTFDQDVQVNTTQGTPSIVLQTGLINREASYVSGSGNSTLSFSYVVLAGDVSADLDYVSTSSLSLNGATIQNENNLNAVLTLPAVGGTGSIAGQHDIVIDGVAPKVIAVSAPGSRYYVENDVFTFAVMFNEKIVVDVSGGFPYLNVVIGTDTVRADFIAIGSGSHAALFQYRIPAGAVDLDGIEVLDEIVLNGGTIKDYAGNDALLTLNNVNNTTDVLVYAVTPQVVLSTSAVSPINSSFTATIVFSEEVTGFTIADINITNGVLENLQKTGTATYTVQVNPTATGDVTLEVPNGVAVNIANTANTASNELIIQYDRTAPAAPIGLFAIPGDTQVTLNWKANSESDVVAYKIYYRMPGSTQVLVATVNAPETSYKHTGLVNGLDYTYQIAAVDRAGNESLRSVEVTAIPIALQTIVFDALATQTYGNDPLTLDAFASSGLPITYSISDPSVAKIVGNKLWLLAAGTVTITANQAGNAAFKVAHPVTQTLVIKPLTLQITAHTGQSKLYGAVDPVLTYTKSSLARGDDERVLTGSLAREPGEELGSYNIHLGSLTAGPNYTLVFQSANFAITPRLLVDTKLQSRSFVYDGTAKSLTVEGNPAGTEIIYTHNSRTDVGTQEVIAVVSGKNFETVELRATLSVTLAERSLNFPALPAKTYGDADFNAGAVASSKEKVRYSSSNLAVAKITESGLIQIVGAGTSMITATVPANSNYSNTPVVQHELRVAKAKQSISLQVPAAVNRDAGTVQIQAISSSGLPVSLTINDPMIATLSGKTLQIHRLGTLEIVATQIGDANYEAATEVRATLKVQESSGTGSIEGIRVHPAFSPNGDGINDILMIEGVRDFPENRVKIFTRNGQLLYEVTGYNNGSVSFRGVDKNNKKLSAGTYFYVLEVKQDGKWKMERGFFVLR